MENGENDPEAASPETPIDSHQVRNALATALRRELLGPGEEDEELREKPSTRYTCGILWPEGTEIEPDQNEPQPPGDNEEDSAGFETIPLVQTLNPSSIGVSVLVDASEEALMVTAEWAEYVRERAGSDEREEGARERPFRWKRSPIRRGPVRVPLAGARQDRKAVGDDELVYVEWLIRSMGNVKAVSIFLVNRRPKPSDATEREERTVFQPRLQLEGSSGQAVILGRHPDTGAGAGELDQRANRLLFRNDLEFAVGHGCAAEWKRESEASDRAVAVSTECVPFYTLPAIQSRDDIPGLELEMGRLGGEVAPEDLRRSLTPLVDSYNSWVDELAGEIPKLAEPHQEQAAIHVARCREASDRTADGIELLCTDENARRAFKFMNEAMQLQRTHTDWAQDFRRTGERSTAPPLKGRWRPFQLAFILQCLRGSIDPEHRDRRLADLLWYPTGGGKTEAYLGLAAFVAMHRRLTARSASEAVGVSVLMRYTLRLLTVQQFQRATILACALEVLRAREPDLGTEPFRVGIWVGGGTTPNSFDESDKSLTRLLASGASDSSSLLDEASPVQIVSCPWCGESMNARHYRAERGRKRTLMGCPRRECEFSFTTRDEGVPAIVVDEEAYRCLPTILIGTVDKFARLPWKGESQALFGRVTRHCPRHGYLSPADDHPEGRHGKRNKLPEVTVTSISPVPPPNLIIQDELHLITGPLGTMMALYESGIDWLCSQVVDSSVIAPKTVASTATIHRASEQVWALLGRDVRVFPPPGLVHTDTFYARQTSASKTGRLYAGVYAPGKSVKTAQVRVMALLSAAAKQWHDIDTAAADPYMTLVGYYNSLRELGGAVNLLRDDVPARIRVLAGREFPERSLWEIKELTSREPSRQIPRTLDRLSIPYSEKGPGKLPIDVLVATNMISVGVDILRLGLMVVVGQPKATAEYIQATSRVGRVDPGLIVTIYNWSRPRDLSHYERFRSYHASLYRHVEASSVTPFASRARDRGLHGIYVGMCRAADLQLTPEMAAVRFARRAKVPTGAMDSLVARAASVAGPEYADAVRQEIEARQDTWEDLAAAGPLRYSWESVERPPPAGVAILLRAAGTEQGGVWPTPSSLREVEAQAGLYLLDQT